MNEEEKNLLKAYLLRKGFEFDAEVLECSQKFKARHYQNSESSALALFQAVFRRVVFKSICDDLYKLFNL